MIKKTSEGKIKKAAQDWQTTFDSIKDKSGINRRDILLKTKNQRAGAIRAIPQAGGGSAE